MADKIPFDPGVPLSGKALVDGLADQWAKILAIILLKHNLRDITITAADMRALGEGEMKYAIVPGPAKTPDAIRIRLMKTADAIEEAKKHKGGFGFS